MVFRALIVLFSYGYNIEIYKIIEATFLTLLFCPMRVFFAGQRRGHGSSRIANTKIQNLHLDKLIAWLVRHGQDTVTTHLLSIEVLYIEVSVTVIYHGSLC